jgi:hypothetical protein
MNLKPHYQIALVYLIVGILWRLWSNLAVALLFQKSEHIIVAQQIKGCGFIIITALLLFFLTRKKIKVVTEVNTKLVKSYEKTMIVWLHLLDLHYWEKKSY